MTTQFYLVQEVHAHDGDVRGLACLKLDPNRFLCASVSRDGTAKIWEMNNTQIATTPKAKAIGHDGFVASVILIPPTELHDFVLITGGNDCKINVYYFGLALLTDEMTLTPRFSLTGHTGVVTALTSVGDSILSVSCDGTMKVWDLVSRVSVKTVRVSEMPLWDIIPLKCEKVAIACADKNIVLLNDKTWSQYRVLTGHTDCVRSLSVVSDNCFLSAGNDGMILEWNALSGVTQNRLDPSIAFIYCVRHFPRLDLTVGCGENGAVSVFINGSITQKIPHPCQTVWNCAINDNGTMITGSSDGFVRVFSVDSTKCSDDLKRTFDESAAIFATRFRLGDQNVQGPEALQRPGNCEGDMMVVRDAPGSFLYQWSGSVWKLIGEVMGGANVENSRGLSKAYDYEFDVDVEEGKPPYKLYYNKNQNPIEVAEAFILVHKLPAAYKSQIVDFILRNTESSNTVMSDATDPFTGGSRYIPGGSAAQTPQKSSLFPLTNYLITANVDLKKLEAKILSFDCVKEIPRDAISSMISLGVEGQEPGNAALALLFEALDNWPEDCLYPVLDIVRLALRNEKTNYLLCDGENGRALMFFIRKTLLGDSPTINATFCVRIVGNMVAHDPGANLVLSDGEEVVTIAYEKLSATRDSKLEVSVATLLANMSYLYKRSATKDMRASLKTMIDGKLALFKGTEARTRVLAALGTIYTYQGCDSIPPEVRSILTEWSSVTGGTSVGSSNSLPAHVNSFLSSFSKF